MVLADKSRNRIGKGDAGDTSSGSRPPVSLSEQGAPVFPNPSSQLEKLLAAHPVDLASVSREIHAHPQLETLIMTLTASLVLSTDGLVNTPEQAAVMLGRDRLRVLAYMWSLLPQIPEAAAFLATISSRAPAGNPVGERISSQAADDWTPESLYLVSFLRWLGLDSPASATSPGQPPCISAGLPRAELAALTDLLMRDFVSLIPMLDPALLRPRSRPAAGDTRARD